MPQPIHRIAFIVLIILGTLTSLLAAVIILAEFFFFATAPTYRFQPSIIEPVALYIAIGTVCFFTVRHLRWNPDT